MPESTNMPAPARRRQVAYEPLLPAVVFLSN